MFFNGLLAHSTTGPDNMDLWIYHEHDLNLLGTQARKNNFLSDTSSKLKIWFRKFRSELKWKGLFRFLLTGILGITSGGGPLISVVIPTEIRRSIFDKPGLCPN